MLRGAGGALVRLEEVADIGPEMASNLIARENSQRKAVVSLNVAEGANLGHLVAEVRERRVDPIVERYGYTVKYGGQFEAQQSASRAILLFSGVVAARHARAARPRDRLAAGLAARAGEPAAGPDRWACSRSS